jgi:hypothetical protein
MSATGARITLTGGQLHNKWRPPGATAAIREAGRPGR